MSASETAGGGMLVGGPSPSPAQTDRQPAFPGPGRGERCHPDTAPQPLLYSVTRAFDPWSQLPVLPGAGCWDAGAA